MPAEELGEIIAGEILCTGRILVSGRLHSHIESERTYGLAQLVTVVIDSRVEPAVQVIVRIAGRLPIIGRLIATVAQLVFVDHILQRNQIGADRSSLSLIHI